MTAKTEDSRQPSRSSAVGDGLWQAMASGANAFGALLVVWLGTRWLSVEEFGELTWAITAITFLGFVARFGTLQSSTILLAKSGGPREELVPAFLAVAGVGSVAVACVWTVVVGVAGGSVGLVRWLVGPWVAASALLGTAGGIMRGMGRFRLSVWFGEHCRKATMLAGLALASSIGVAWIIVIAAVGDIAVVACSIIVVRRMVGPTGLELRRIREVVERSVPFAIDSVSTAAVPAAAILVAGFLVEADVLAELGVAVRLFAFLNLGYQVFVRVATPRLAGASGSNALRAVVGDIRGVLLAIACGQAAATGALVLFGESFISALFGDDLAGAATPTALFLLGGMANTWFGPAMLTLACTGYERPLAALRFGFALVSTVAASAGVVLMGAAGVAAAFAISAVAVNATAWWIVLARVGVDTMPIPLVKTSLR